MRRRRPICATLNESDAPFLFALSFLSLNQLSLRKWSIGLRQPLKAFRSMSSELAVGK